MLIKFYLSIQITQVSLLKFHTFFKETLSMKALTLNATKKKVEGFNIIKQALFKNLKNFTCWHVYGILNRSHK